MPQAAPPEGISGVGLADITSSDPQYSVSPTSLQLARQFGSDMIDSLRRSAAMKRHCSTCHTLISPARLKAKPNATQCVPCLEAAGDVAPVHETAARSSERNSDLLIDLTEAPILPVEIDTTCAQTNEEIIEGLNELEGADTWEE
jgi:hypothetical protein